MNSGRKNIRNVCHDLKCQIVTGILILFNKVSWDYLTQKSFKGGFLVFQYRQKFSECFN